MPCRMSYIFREVAQPHTYEPRDGAWNGMLQRYPTWKVTNLPKHGHEYTVPRSETPMLVHLLSPLVKKAYAISIDSLRCFRSEFGVQGSGEMSFLIIMRRTPPAQDRLLSVSVASIKVQWRNRSRSPISQRSSLHTFTRLRPFASNCST